MNNLLTANNNILIIEDDPGLSQQLASLVQDAGYTANCCLDGDSGLLEATKQQYQLILLDLMLPKRDGFSVLSMLRKISSVPVIVVTAKGAEEERIRGFRQGADDYIAKPFSPVELLLRIEALLRRTLQTKPQAGKTARLDSLHLDSQQHSVLVEDQAVELTQTQFSLLWELVLHQGEVLSKAYLSQQALNRTLGAYDRGLDMHISRIRRKLNTAGWQGERLQTVHGKGYCLK